MDMPINNEVKELNQEELDNVAGGKYVPAGGEPHLDPKAGYIIHHITSHDTLIRIANHYGVTVQAIMKANPSIKDKNLIRTGYYLYIPVK